MKMNSAKKKTAKKRMPITRKSKKDKIKAAIIQAALELAERQGFEKTAVDEIAAGAEVSTRTFYRYFPTKDHVMFPYHDEYVAEFRSLLEKRKAEEPSLEIVRRALRTMAELYLSNRKEHWRFHRIISSSPSLVARSVPLDADWREAIAEAWFKDRRPNDENRQEANLIAGAVTGVINAVMSMWYEAGCPDNLVAQGERALNLLKRGIGNGSNLKAPDAGTGRRLLEE